MHGPHQLILTVDYEVFGNGSGCVYQCVCAPLERLARLVEAHGGKLEIFVEAVEFSAMENEPGHAEVTAVKRQLSDMLRRGHRIQMHVHPQWWGARLDGHEWIFNSDIWRTGDAGREQLLRMIESAQNWIRNAVQDVSPDYKCSVFRAGGWCIQPSREVLRVLWATGLRADSSVAPGLTNHDPGAWYDFRVCPGKSWWPVDTEVDRLGTGDFLEVPIAVGRVAVSRHLRARMARRREGEFAPGCRGTYRGREAGMMARLSGVWHKLRSSRQAMLDYCVLPADLMIDVAQDWVGRFRRVDAPVPLVAIGHTKNFSENAESELDRFLAWVLEQDGFSMGSYNSWYKAAFGASAEPLGNAVDQLDSGAEHGDFSGQHSQASTVSRASSAGKEDVSTARFGEAWKGSIT